MTLRFPFIVYIIIYVCFYYIYIYVLLKNLAIVQNKLAGCGQSAEAARM